MIAVYADWNEEWVDVLVFQILYLSVNLSNHLLNHFKSCPDEDQKELCEKPCDDDFFVCVEEICDGDFTDVKCVEHCTTVHGECEMQCPCFIGGECEDGCPCPNFSCEPLQVPLFISKWSQNDTYFQSNKN